MQSMVSAIQDAQGSQATRPETCAQHGDYESRNIFMRIWTKCPVCAEEAKQREEQAREDKERLEQVARWEKKLGASGIPARFKTRTLPGFDAPLPEQKAALAFAEHYAAEFKDGHSGRCAIFIGHPGTGKTHLACGIALRAMSRHGISALFTTVSKMTRRIRESKSFDVEETESQAIAVFTFPHLLIIDEVGLQSGTDAEARSLFDVINERYENYRPTIFLSNLDTDGVRDALGPRVFDRIREDGGEVVPFTWGSHRGEKTV